METIKDREDALFEEYRNKYKDRLHLFCTDGLHCVGTACKCGRNGVWKMVTEDDEHWSNATIQWETSPIRPLFLTKDYNHGGEDLGIDLRIETGINNENDKIYHQFYGRYLQLLYGLHHINLQVGKYPSQEEAKARCLEYFQHASVVRMNLKKIAGGRSCTNECLRRYIIKDRELLIRQIDLYGAIIIVACHGSDPTPTGKWDSNPIMEFLFGIYPDLICVLNIEPKFLYYSKRANLIVLHEWHMSYPVRYKTYYNAVSHVGDFINYFPQEAAKIFRPLTFKY